MAVPLVTLRMPPEIWRSPPIVSVEVAGEFAFNRKSRVLPPVLAMIRLPATEVTAPCCCQAAANVATLIFKLPHETTGRGTGLEPVPSPHFWISTVLEAPNVRVPLPGMSEAAPFVDAPAALWT